jgi:hypothetical protein
MKKRITKNTRERQITRRELVGGALAAAGGVITGAPAFLRGQNLNNKLNIAMIACGGRANANMNGDGGSRRRGRGARAAAPSGPPTGIPAENITVLCDVNQHAVDAAAQKFPKAKKYNDFRRVFDSPNNPTVMRNNKNLNRQNLSTRIFFLSRFRLSQRAASSKI